MTPRGVTSSLVLLVPLAALAMFDPPKYRRHEETLARKVVRALYKDEINREAREQATAAYYEGLLNQGSRVSAMNRLLSGHKVIDWEAWNRPWRRYRGDFRYYDMPPNLTYRSPRGANYDVVTNSHGMVDREYVVRKAPSTWRIALIGDSLSRGHGAIFGHYFETLLEDALNTPLGTRADGRPRVEILNFAVGGYRITQFVDVAVEWAPQFVPDLYVVAFTELTVFKRWGDHITALVQNGVDLKYDYLRRLATRARLRPDDPAGTADAKLAPFRLETLEWGVRQIRTRAVRTGAKMLVLLLPNVNDHEILEEEFGGVREMLDEIGVTYVDLLDAFADVRQPSLYQASATDVHPNSLGHRLLFERLHAKIQADPRLLELFSGQAADSAPDSEAD